MLGFWSHQHVGAVYGIHIPTMVSTLVCILVETLGMEGILRTHVAYPLGQSGRDPIRAHGPKQNEPIKRVQSFLKLSG